MITGLEFVALVLILAVWTQLIDHCLAPLTVRPSSTPRTTSAVPRRRSPGRGRARGAGRPADDTPPQRRAARQKTRPSAVAGPAGRPTPPRRRCRHARRWRQHSRRPGQPIRGDRASHTTGA